MALECTRFAAERFVGEPGAGVDSVLDMRRHQFRAEESANNEIERRSFIAAASLGALFLCTFSITVALSLKS